MIRLNELNTLQAIISNQQSLPHYLSTMAAAISALNAKIRSHPYLSYFCSTRTFFGSIKARRIVDVGFGVD